MSKLKLEKLLRNAENIILIFDITYVIKLLNFKLKKPKLKHFRNYEK